MTLPDYETVHYSKAIILCRHQLIIKTLNPSCKFPLGHDSILSHFFLYIPPLSPYFWLLLYFHVVRGSKHYKSSDSRLTFLPRLSLHQGDQCGEEHAERGPGLLWEAVRQEAERQTPQLLSAGGQWGEWTGVSEWGMKCLAEVWLLQ